MVKIKDTIGWDKVGPKKDKKPDGEGNNPYSYGVYRGHNTCLESVEELSVEMDREELIRIVCKWFYAEPTESENAALQDLADAIIANQAKILRVKK